MGKSKIIIVIKASILFIIISVSMCYCVVLTAYSIACSSINLNRSSMSVSDLVLESAFRKLIKFAVSQLSGISSVYFSFDINPIISSSSFVLS